MSLFFKLPSDISPLFDDCLKSAKNVYCDQLDCSVSVCRQPTNRTIDEIMAMETVRFDFIFRSYENIYQFVAATMNPLKPDYFIWIDLEPLEGDKIVEKYKLIRR